MTGCRLFALVFCPIQIALLWSLHGFPQEEATDHTVMKGCVSHVECSQHSWSCRYTSQQPVRPLGCLILQSWSWFIWAKVFSWLQQDLFLWYFLAWCTTCPISLTRQWQQDTYKLLLTNVSRNQQTFLKEPESKYFRLAGRVVRVVTMTYSVAVVLTAIGNGHGCVTIMFYFQKLYGGSYLAYGW